MKKKNANNAAIMSYLSEHECPAITTRRLKRSKAGGIDIPIVFKKAQGLEVTDADDNTFLDLTAGFGVMALGYSHPKVVEAGIEQLQRLQHTMGDAYCAQEKYFLFKQIFNCIPKEFKYLSRILLGITGSDGVEAAIKTALMNKKNAKIACFSGSYHGLSLGALSVTHYKDSFRAPFENALNHNTIELPFPDENTTFQLDEHCDAIIIELIQGRGGIREIPRTYLMDLQDFCKKNNIFIIVDEIFTGCYRTGPFLCSEYYSDFFRPDMIILGKGISGGTPISALLASDEIMNAWGDSIGEAIHTSTFLGNPLSCAMATKNLEVLSEMNISTYVHEINEYLMQKLARFSVTGKGLMIGIKTPHTLTISKLLLEYGFIILPCGINNDILSFTPPLIITKEQIDKFVLALRFALLQKEVAEFIEFEPNDNDVSFNKLAIDSFYYQCDTIPNYKKWAQNCLGDEYDKLNLWTQIPALPVEIFKEKELTTHPSEKIHFRFYTSGTTTEKKGVHPYYDLEMYRSIIIKLFKNYFDTSSKITFRVLTPNHYESKNRSLNFMFTTIVEEFGSTESAFYYKNDVLDSATLHKDLLNDIQNQQPVFLLGTTFAYLQFIEHQSSLKMDSSLRLPSRSRLLDTGGSKGLTKSISNNDFSTLVESTFGITQEYQWSEYGMTELTSHFYGKKTQSISFRAPHWVRVSTDPVNNVLTIFDLANFDFVSKILTGDCANILPEDPNTFQLSGRKPGISLRGCSLDYEKIIDKNT